MKPFPTFSLAFFFLVSLPTVASADQLMIYPKKGQDQAQQDKDRYECHRWAVENTGIDPTDPVTLTANVPSEQETKQKVASAGQGATVRGGARGAAGGAAIGAIAGDAGKGAAIGATAGALRGVGARRRAKAKAHAQQSKKAETAQTDAMARYNRARKTCLEGRNYSVN